jgi:hypothetical protein
MNGACAEPLLPVGRDCDCGAPLVWMRGAQRCAVYGTHPAPVDVVHFRNLAAPGAELVNMLSARKPAARRLRAVS